MTPSGRKCWGHADRIATENKINKLLASPSQPLDQNYRVLIKRGPLRVETSLKELEEIYAGKAEWTKIEDGGLLSVPVEELRMMDPPQPKHSGRLEFGKGGRDTKIDNYAIGQTIPTLNALIVDEFNKAKENLLASGESEVDAESKARSKAFHLPQFKAVRAWQDVEAEIKVKGSLEDLLRAKKIPSLVIRSVSLKGLFALRSLGLDIPCGDAELDLLLAFVIGDILQVTIIEVKRADTYPWLRECVPLNKQAVDKAEKQLNKDVDIVAALLAGIPVNQIRLSALACFPGTSRGELEKNICSDCLDTKVVCQEDLADMTQVQRKILLPDKVVQATARGKEHLLTLTSRCLSHHSLLHIGYREVEDKEKLVTERHRYNLETVDGKMMEKEFIVASPQQQQIFSSLTTSSSKRHLLLEGPAGTGKTLVAVQVAINLIEHATSAKSEEGLEPLLVVTGHCRGRDNPLMKYLDASTARVANKICMGWFEILEEFVEPTGILESTQEDLDMQLINVISSLVKRWEGRRQIVILLDEIYYDDVMSHLCRTIIPPSVRLVMVLNPKAPLGPLDLPSSFLHVTLTTPYRSTIAITSLARFLAKCHNLEFPEGDFGSDVQGLRPVFFDVGNDENKMKEAMILCSKFLGEKATLLVTGNLLRSKSIYGKIAYEQGQKAGSLWECYQAFDFYGSEAERVMVITDGEDLMEMVTRAQTHLCVILVDDHFTLYAKTRDYFRKAAGQGLVEEVTLGAPAYDGGLVLALVIVAGLFVTLGLIRRNL